ncbi:MAG: zinc ribbon domain-containing protein, partial [Firmicutes bacterium]|nr:zinc ribbon domain-containing protein [Bacillota bacterium]
MVCKHCGAMLPDDALFCGDCGKPVEKNDKSKVIDV